ncbi:MAG: hypothetical protein KBG73_04315 [Candidatus Promineofilum sp.]|nr:hypothetical protein [Promineifilum sp.]
MQTHQLSNGGIAGAGRLAAMIGLLLALAACAPPPAAPSATAAATATTAAPPEVTATDAPTTTPATLPATRYLPPAAPIATRHSPPATPLVLSPNDCPAPAETYRNEVMGIELPVPAGLSVHEPQYLFSDYGVSLAGAAESPPLQVSWLYQKTPAELEALVAEELAQLADLPTQRAPVVVAGVEGDMLWPVPGEVEHTEIYLPVDGRLFRLLAPSAPLDDTGRCLLAGLRFFPPTRTLAELHLPTDTGVPAAPSPVLPDATLPADPTTWAEYHDDTYGFSFLYPDGRWTVIEPTADNPHRLSLAYHELGIALRLAVARAGEDADLQLYGGRAGDFVPLDDVLFIGEPVSANALVHKSVTWAVYYNNTAPIARGNLLFSVALVSNRNFERGAVVPEEVWAEANRIIETLMLDGE